MLIKSERFWKMVSLLVGFEHVENVETACMNYGSVAYENDLMIGVYRLWIALDLHLGHCLCYLAVLHLQVSSLGGLLRLDIHACCCILC
jgi:hypothetical protein